MNIALWIAQGLLAAAFLASGYAKSTQTKEKMIATGQTGVAPFPLPVIRVVAALEVAAAVGLILPWATDIAPVLTPLAGVGEWELAHPRTLRSAGVGCHRISGGGRRERDLVDAG